MYSAFASVMSVVNAENLAAFAEGVPIPHMEWGWANYLADCHMAHTQKVSDYQYGNPYGQYSRRGDSSLLRNGPCKEDRGQKL